MESGGKMKKILVLGGSGMLGSMVTNVFSKSEFETTATVRTTELIAESKKNLGNVNWIFFSIRDFIKSPEAYSSFNSYDWIINCIGITKPYCKDDNPDQIENAVVINSLFPNQLAKYFPNTKILQIATDCVYSGREGNYSENSIHDPIDVYGKTKSLGESKFTNLFNLRCSIIGPEFNRKAFLIEWLLSQQKDGEVNGFTNHDWNGVTTLQFGKVCLGIIKNGSAPKNLQHLVPADRVNKFELLKLLSTSFGRPDIKVREFVAKDKIDRTLLTNDNEYNEKIWNLAGYNQAPTIEEMIKECSEYHYPFK